LNGQQIGIKLADGSFYPVLPEGGRSKKKLVLTTVRDNQETVQIDLYRGEGEIAEDTQYVGSLMIENLQPAPMKEPEVEVVLGVDEQGNLEAIASDALSGESQSLSVSLQSLSDGPATVPQFELEREGAASRGEGESEDFEESLLTGETYPIAATDRRREHLHKKRRSPLLLIGFILLSLILIGGLAFVVYRALDGQPIPALFGGKSEAAQAPVAGAGTETESEDAGSADEAEPQDTEPAAAEQQAAQAPAAGATESEAESAAGGLWYEVKWGDTLWDISATYYRNPWLYPKIAKQNSITNPDLIFAGTKLFIPEN
jgi:nucleoid-associated protein YgaU